MTDKRKKIEDLIYKTLSLLDPTGINTKKYQATFVKMSDQQFSKWVTDFLGDEKSNIRLDVEEFGGGARVLKYENIEKAANFLGIKLYEYVYIPHLSSNPNRPIRTKQPVLVGWLNVKRTQQLASKKTGLAAGDNDRDELSGTIKGDDKGGTTTAIENLVLAGVGADIIISEISGARGDNVHEYDNMIKSISEHGSVKLSDIKTNVYDKPTLLMADMYFMAMGLKTDLISESYYGTGNIKKIIDQE